MKNINLSTLLHHGVSYYSGEVSQDFIAFMLKVYDRAQNTENQQAVIILNSHGGHSETSMQAQAILKVLQKKNTNICDCIRAMRFGSF